MALSILLYTGLLIVVSGLVCLVRPLRLLHVPSRRRAALVAIAGAAIMTVALAWPFRTSFATNRTTQLDEFMPEWQFNETHSIHVTASPERVFAAIRAVTADEIPLFQLLTAIRRGGRPGPESILNAPGQKPLLDVVTATSFILLVDAPPRELVVGTVISAPAAVRQGRRLTPRDFPGTPLAGVTLATMNFLVTPDGAGGSNVSTETRVRSGDVSAARRFAFYWRAIRPGSDIIRRMWLRAIKRRAERA